MHVRVDDGVNRLGGQRADGREHLRCHRGCRGIHQQHAIVANLHRDVHAVDHEHVHVALHVEHADGRRRGALWLPLGDRRRCADRERR